MQTRTKFQADLARLGKLALSMVLVAGCKDSKPPAAPAFQALPVQVAPVSLEPVPTSDTYVATVKSRRSATLQPQVDGNLTRIYVHSGQTVKAGQVLMQIDPLKQVATVQQQQGTEAQQKSVYLYNQGDVERQKQLYQAGIISKQAYDQAVQSFGNAKGAYDASVAQTNTQRQQLAYYQIRAPFAGIVGDIPVNLGDYVTAATQLTTVDEHTDLEAYIYLPTERASSIHTGLPVEILDDAGKTVAETSVYFLSPQVENGLQSILVKAHLPGKASDNRFRTDQLVKARVIWSTTSAPVIPVLAVTRIGGQSFVYIVAPAPAAPPALAHSSEAQAQTAPPAPKPAYIAHQVPVTVGDTIGNNYPVLKGLRTGDRVIISGLQMLQDGAPVQPLN